MDRLTRASISAALVVALQLAACGGGGYSSSAPPPPPPPPVAPLEVQVTGMAVVKARASVDGVTVLEEKPTSLLETGPQRRITMLDQSGAVRARYSPPQGFSLIDFAQHAQGEVSVALASARTM